MLPNSQFPADLVTFTEEILNGKLPFFLLCLSYDIKKDFNWISLPRMYAGRGIAWTHFFVRHWLTFIMLNTNFGN